MLCMLLSYRWQTAAAEAALMMCALTNQQSFLTGLIRLLEPATWGLQTLASADPLQAPILGAAFKTNPC